MVVELWPLIAGLTAISLGVIGLWRRAAMVRVIEFIGEMYAQVSSRAFPVKTAWVTIVAGRFLWGILVTLGSFGIHW